MQRRFVNKEWVQIRQEWRGRGKPNLLELSDGGFMLERSTGTCIPTREEVVNRLAGRDLIRALNWLGDPESVAAAMELEVLNVFAEGQVIDSQTVPF